MSATRDQRLALEALLAAYALEGEAEGAFARAWEAARSVPGAAVALWDARPVRWRRGWSGPHLGLCVEDTTAYLACKSLVAGIRRRAFRRADEAARVARDNAKRAWAEVERVRAEGGVALEVAYCAALDADSAVHAAEAAYRAAQATQQIEREGS